jgi:hypothetical protein
MIRRKFNKKECYAHESLGKKWYKEGEGEDYFSPSLADQDFLLNKRTSFFLLRILGHTWGISSVYFP